MARKLDMIKDIDGNRETLKLAVKIIDLWVVGNKDFSISKGYMEMILMDQKVTWSKVLFFYMRIYYDSDFLYKVVFKNQLFYSSSSKEAITLLFCFHMFNCYSSKVVCTHFLTQLCFHIRNFYSSKYLLMLLIR